jgi:hypothetical protein
LLHNSDLNAIAWPTIPQFLCRRRAVLLALKVVLHKAERPAHNATEQPRQHSETKRNSSTQNAGGGIVMTYLPLQSVLDYIFG